jgi:hypothetical protein
MTVTPDQVAADLLLEELVSRGVRAEVHGAGVRLWPKEKVAAGQITRLRRYKAEVVRALRLAALDEERVYEWQERVAICMEDGRLGREDAEAVAWKQVDCDQARPQDAHVGPGAAVAAQREGIANRGETTPCGPP